MTISPLFGLALLVAILCALATGSLFAFSTFVMPALSRLPATQAIAAMQSINIAVINPLFMGAFMGAAALFLALIAGQWSNLGGAPGVLTIIAAALYVGGTIGITMVFNVPLNNGLATVDAAAAGADATWSAYVGAWQFWNHIRTLTGTLALATLILAMVEMRITTGR